MKLDKTTQRVIRVEKIPQRIEFAIQLIEFHFDRLHYSPAPSSRPKTKASEGDRSVKEILFIEIFLSIDPKDYKRIKSWDHPPLWQKALAPIPGATGRLLSRILPSKHIFVLNRDQFALNQDILYKYLAHDWSLSDEQYPLAEFSFDRGNLRLFFYDNQEREKQIQFLYHMWRKGIVTNYMLERP